DWAELARKSEGLGYSTLFMPDHFGDQLAPMPAIMAAADATTELKVGALVFDNDYKHPVVFAKEIATVDVLSGGRVELGIGAGWNTGDYREPRIAYDPPAERVAGIEEATRLVERLRREDVGDHSGTHYQISRARNLPRPAQDT